MAHADISFGELYRMLTQLQGRVDRCISSDLHESERRELERRWAEVERELAEIRELHRQDLDKVEHRREADTKDRLNSRRWVIAAVLLPVVSVVANVILRLQSIQVGAG